jgi:PAS domain S-box-containing protein
MAGFAWDASTSAGTSEEEDMPPVLFRFRHPRASTVTLAGDFNGWNTTSHPLERQADQLKDAGIWPDAPTRPLSAAPPDIAWVLAKSPRPRSVTAAGSQRPVVILAPAGPRKQSDARWPIDRYGELARRLQDEGFDIVIIGALDDAPLAHAVQRKAPRARDITGRKRAEKQLQRSTAYLAEAQRLSHTGSWGFTVAGGEVFWSEETFRIFGLDAAKIKPTRARFFQCLHPEDRPLIEAVEAELGAGKDLEFDYRIIRPDRSVRYIHSQAHPVVDESGTLIEFIGTVMDVTERRRAEEALRESQAALARVSRVAVLGELTASIAHEINQPLAAVVTNGSAALRWLATRPPNLDEVREALRRVIREANRTGDVVERIRALLKKKPPQMQALHMNAVIREVLSSVDNELRTGGITIQTELAADIPMVLGDRVQLQEVMLNLILNSIDAMSALADRPRYLLITSTKDCEGVLVQVQDSGKGLDPRQVHKIFEPFFSTKPEGIGLGLSISRSIIEAHGGRLWATSGSPHGAVFQFILPEQVVPHD